MKIGIISGASAGIGKEIAIELDRQHLDELWLISRNEKRLSELKEAIKTPSRCFSLDLSKDESFVVISNELKKQDYLVEYLVLSAGVGYTGTVENNSQNQISAMIDLNCKGLSLMINAVLPHICQKGKIITVASGAGFLPQADFAVYAATKAYVISLSRALKKELKLREINVCAVCPGPVDTDFFAGLENVKNYKKKYLISPRRVAIGSIKASKKGKAIYTPTFAIKALHLCSKILPTSILLKMGK